MGNIRILPEQVANQIAAGEVIERPASIIRELLDNSVDAGADEISVKIVEGGKDLIRVKDNGSGMSRSDMALALERHATSKINTVEDIFAIKTLGFRGEALPSIASVSHIEMTSRIADELSGNRLKASGGNVESIDEIGAPVGTTVEVRDLFYNTPARRKFLKSSNTETGHIIDTLTRIILPFTGIRIRLDSQDKMLLNLPASDNELNRLSVLFGRDVATSLIDTHQEIEGMKIRTYLAHPEQNRARGDKLYIYVNKRNIRDKLIIRSIMEGYGQRLMKGRYPQVVLYMEIDPTLIDINVHPAKQEIRFHQTSIVFRAVSSTIEKALQDQIKPVSESGYRPTAPISRKGFGEREIEKSQWEFREELPKGISGTILEPQQEYLVKEVPQVIGQLKDTYLLFEAKDGLLLMDQHAAHERIVYENLKKSYQAAKIERQAFLIPHTLELSMKEGRVVEKNINQLEDLGFEFEHFGGTTFLLRSVPSILVNTDWEDFILDLIPILEEEKDITNEKALDRLLTVIACHGAIRAGKRMSMNEMNALLEELEKMDLPTNCPHGRPIFKKFSYNEIEKMFKRIV